MGSHYSFRSEPSFLATHPPGARPDRAGKFINKHVISHSKKVLKSFPARLHIATRYVLEGCEDRLSIASPAIEILTTTCTPFIDRGVSLNSSNPQYTHPSFKWRCMHDHQTCLDSNMFGSASKLTYCH